ncbi:extracellular dioxygenase [Favolaschia claudopus]|uniref:Extracellular dioxygenase n=1 Tax=Favolaschia claudopus TaxID=2862362 RepID=A0AAW0EEV0_9AGAR
MRLSFFFVTAACGLALAVPATDRRDASIVSGRAFYAELVNNTCVLAPEVPMANYVSNPPMRTDVSDNQPGVPFLVDIGIVNTATCQALSNVMVEIWSTNAAGQFSSTSLRGATMTNSNGIAEFKTIFPGFTSDSANHLSFLVRSSSSRSSPVIHQGRLFFTDPWTDMIAKSANYTQNTNSRITNDEDPNFAKANENGFNSIINIVSIGDDWADPQGIIGDITVGVNP